MSFNGSGTFVINSSGQPVVTGTVISSTAFNSLTADLGTGLSTTITKDGQTTTTAKIPFAFGLSAAAASNFAAGTVAAPGLYLSTDTGTGLYRIGANNDGFAVSGAKVLDIASTGLAVTGTLSATGAATLSSTLGVTGTSTLRTTSLRDTTPEANNAYGLGTNALRWGDFKTQIGQCYGLLDVGTADINIGFAKAMSVLATSAAGAIVAKTVDVGYPVLAGWNAADAGDNTFQYFYANSAGDLKGSIDFNRTGNATRYNTTSDATMKNLIGDAPQTRSLEILSQTRLREYSWKFDETNKPHIGVIAQELVEVFPGAVSVGGDLASTDEGGNPTTKYHPWSVDKTAYQFHLVAGWQSHEAKISALEARLAVLEAK